MEIGYILLVLVFGASFVVCLRSLYNFIDKNVDFDYEMGMIKSK